MLVPSYEKETERKQQARIVVAKKCGRQTQGEKAKKDQKGEGQ